MAENSAIEWTHHTFNPHEGCTKVGPGCDNCYAEARDIRFTGGAHWGPHAPRRRTSAANWRKPLKWNRAAAKAGQRHRVFCASLADVFDNHPSITDDMRRELGVLILATPHLDWMLLTKRIGNALRYLAIMFPNGIPANVWIGATIVNQEEADRDIPKLLDVPAKVRFLSIEPMLGPIDLRGLVPQITCGAWCKIACTASGDEECSKHLPGLHLIICGGESGPKARPMHIDWARFLRDQCVAGDIAFLFKQWGEWSPGGFLPKAGSCGPDRVGWIRPDGTWATASDPDSHLFCESPGRSHILRVGKARAGRLLDGRTWDQMPGEVAA